MRRCSWGLLGVAVALAGACSQPVLVGATYVHYVDGASYYTGVHHLYAVPHAHVLPGSYIAVRPSWTYPCRAEHWWLIPAGPTWCPGCAAAVAAPPARDAAGGQLPPPPAGLEYYCPAHPNADVGRNPTCPQCGAWVHLRRKSS